MEVTVTNKPIAEELKPCILEGPFMAPQETLNERAVLCSELKPVQNQQAKGSKKAAIRKSNKQNNEKGKIYALKGKKSKKEQFAAVQRMYWKCIRYGIPVSKVLKAVTQISKLSGKPKKKTTIPNKKKETKLTKSTPVQKSKVGSNSEVAILQQNYPLDSLNTNQIQMIQDDLLKKVQAQRTSKIKPAFLGVTSKSGYLVLNCANKDTADWVKSLGGKIIPWEGAALKIIEADQLSKEYTVEMSFPNSKPDSINNILSLIQAQNSELVTDQWKVVHRIDTKQASVIKFSLDYSSAEVLKNKSKRLNYKWGQISFNLEEKKPPPPPPPPTPTKPKCTAGFSSSTPCTAPPSSSGQKSSPPSIPSQSLNTGPPAPPAQATRKKKKKKKKRVQPKNPGSRDPRLKFSQLRHNSWGESSSLGNYFQSDEYFNQPGSSQCPRGEPYDEGNYFRMNQERIFTNPGREQFIQESLMADFEERTRAFLQFRDEYMNQATNFQNLMGDFGNSPFDNMKNRYTNQPNNPQFGPRNSFNL